jgi:hypothetical protein
VSFQVDQQCYSDAAGASSAIASKSVGMVVDVGGTAYVINAPTIAGAAVTYNLVPVGGGTTITHTQTLDLQPCALIDWEDASLLAWGVATAWIAVAAVMFLRGAR